MQGIECFGGKLGDSEANKSHVGSIVEKLGISLLMDSAEM